MNNHLKFICLCLMWHIVVYSVWWCTGEPIQRGPTLATIEGSTILMCFWSVLPAYDI